MTVDMSINLRPGGPEDGISISSKFNRVTLLNSYAWEGFRYGAWEVKTLVTEATVPEEAAPAQGRLFAVVNGGCCYW